MKGSPAGRAAFIGLMVVLVSWCVLKGIPGVVRYVLRTEAGLQELAFILGRDRGEVAFGQSLTYADAVPKEQIVSLAPSLLSGSSPEAAFDDLATRVSAAAGSSRARLEQLEAVADPSTAGWLRRSALRVSLESDIRGMVETLNSLMAGPVLRVEDIHILTTGDRQSAGAAEVLRSEFTVRGWYLARTGEDSTTAGARDIQQ
ncbi:MAG: GspMb/PilO family protein [Gemmatimonadales bacterium]